MKSLLQGAARLNLVVAGVAFLLTVAGTRWLGAPPNWVFLGWITVGAWWGYTLDRRLPFSPEDKSRPHHGRRWIWGGLVVSAAWLGWGALLLPWRGDLFLFVLAGTATAYVAPILPGRRRLKEFPYAKTVALSVGWAVATVALPVVDAGLTLDTSVWALTGYRTLYLLPNVLLSDWPDRNADRAAGILTPANQWGEKTLCLVCRGTCFFAAFAALIGWSLSLFPVALLSELVGTAGFLALTRRPLPDSGFRYRVTADGLAGWPGIPACLLFLLS